MTPGLGPASVAADARVAANPQHEIRWVSGRLDDLVLRQAGHGRACDRSGEPVPCFHELVLGPLVVLEGQG